jgi:hypothetical protein
MVVFYFLFLERRMFMSPETAPSLPENRAAYKYLFFALSLAIVIAILEATVLTTLLNAHSPSTDGSIYRTSAPVIVALGISIQSNIIRYLGGVWLALMGLASIWPLFGSNSTHWSALTVLLLVSGVLSLALAAVLLASKDFGKQFGLARTRHSHLKKTLRTCIIVVGILGAIIATYNDIVNLTR